MDSNQNSGGFLADLLINALKINGHFRSDDHAPFIHGLFTSGLLSGGHVTWRQLGQLTS